MSPKQYLSRAMYAQQRIDTRLRELQSIQARAEGLTSPALTGMPSGTRMDYAAALDALIDVKTRIEGELIELERIKAEIAAAINTVDDPRYRTLLELRYRAFMTWEQIAEQMHCDLRTVYRWHGEALLRVKL